MNFFIPKFNLHVISTSVIGCFYVRTVFRTEIYTVRFIFLSQDLLRNFYATSFSWTWWFGPQYVLFHTIEWKEDKIILFCLFRVCWKEFFLIFDRRLSEFKTEYFRLPHKAHKAGKGTTSVGEFQKTAFFQSTKKIHQKFLLCSPFHLSFLFNGRNQLVILQDTLGKSLILQKWEIYIF